MWLSGWSIWEFGGWGILHGLVSNHYFWMDDFKNVLFVVRA